MIEERPDCFIHPTAEVSSEATIESGVKIWDDVRIRRGTYIGPNTTIGRGVYIDPEIRIGANCKIQNNCQIYRHTQLEDGVFVGPQACFANDRFPRAVTPDGILKTTDDWEPGSIKVCYGASIGAHATIIPSVTIGRFAMVGAGAVVIKDVPEYGLVVGVRARLIGYVCPCGNRLVLTDNNWKCSNCGWMNNRPHLIHSENIKTGYSSL